MKKALYRGLDLMFSAAVIAATCTVLGAAMYGLLVRGIVK